MGDGRWGCKWGGTMGTNGSQAAARGAAFNLIVLRTNRDRDQWYSTVIRMRERPRQKAKNEMPTSSKQTDSHLILNYQRLFLMLNNTRLFHGHATFITIICF